MGSRVAPTATGQLAPACLEPLDGLGDGAHVDPALEREEEREARQRDTARRAHGGPIAAHAQAETFFHEAGDARRDPLRGPPSAHEDAHVVGVAHEAVTVCLEPGVEVLEHDGGERWRERGPGGAPSPAACLAPSTMTPAARWTRMSRRNRPSVTLRATRAMSTS